MRRARCAQGYGGGLRARAGTRRRPRAIHSDLWHDDCAAPRAARLVGGPWGHPGRHGIDGRLRKPVYYVLEDALECWLLNARHLRNVPGRKTDVAAAAWIWQLVEHGLVRPSFVPPKPIRELRNLTRYRKAQIEERTREAQRLDKILQDAGIKLSSVASDVLGVSGRAMLGALVDGTRDPAVLAALARGALRKKIPALREALRGRFGPHHALLVGTILAKLEFLDDAIAQLSAEIEQVIAPFAHE